MSNNINNLPRFQPRRFVAQEGDFTQLDVIKPYYEDLLSRSVDSARALEKWVLDRSELDAVCDQAGSIVYINMTCQTDDESRAKAYQDLIQNVLPAIKPLEDQLNRKFLELYEKYPLNEERYLVYVREIKADIELFCEANIELETKLGLLSQQYQTVTGAMTVEFEGCEQTMPEMSKYQLETDRDLRERAWKAVYERRSQDTEKLEDIFDQMIALRAQIAKNAGCKNYAEYKFRDLHRFDYTVDDCKAYHKTVEECVVPLHRRLIKKHKELLGLDELRPWDTAVDSLGRPPLKPFDKIEALIQGVQNIFDKVDGELAAFYKDMDELGCLDLASRKGKAPGGYQSTLNEARKPFIFMNAVGVDGDVNTLLHEAGHAFHSLLCADDPITDYRHGPMEFCEVASMAMELIGSEHLSEFYNEEDKKRSITDHLEGIVFVLVWVATIDCFQHWIYENPAHSREERKDTWLYILKRFGGAEVNWEGFEEARAHMWHKQLHIFEVPFYYIEYGIAQLGALQIWLNSKKDKHAAIAQYKKGLSLGGSRPLPELFENAGIHFDFSKSTIEPLVKILETELEATRTS